MATNQKSSQKSNIHYWEHLTCFVCVNSYQAWKMTSRAKKEEKRHKQLPLPRPLHPSSYPHYMHSWRGQKRFTWRSHSRHHLQLQATVHLWKSSAEKPNNLVFRHHHDCFSITPLIKWTLNQPKEIEPSRRNHRPRLLLNSLHLKYQMRKHRWMMRKKLLRVKSLKRIMSK